MIIEKISCESFAGKSDLNLELGEGLNLIVGENESGKTTVADLARSVLLQGATVDGRKEKDKSFEELYYPSVDRSVKPTPDGTVVLATDDGKYRITKEWGKKGNSAVSLRFPDGTKIKDDKSVEEELDTILMHGKGTYDQVVFSSQRHPFESLPSALNLQGANADLRTALSRAVLETGGMNLNEFKEKLDEKVSSLEKKWDVAQDVPERKSGGGRYSVKQGDPSILAAYYAREDACKELEDIGNLERQYEEKAASIRQFKEESDKKQKEIDAFDQSRTALDKRKTLQDQKENAENAVTNAQNAYASADNSLKEANGKLIKAKSVYEKWPKEKQLFDRFDNLFSERENAETLAGLQKRLKNLQALHKDMEEKAAACKNDAPSTNDVQLARKLQKEIDSNKAKLSGINLSALLELESGASISVTKLSDGSEIPVECGKFDITESVNIVVPGVMSLQLAPKNVDAKALSEEISKHTNELKGLLAKFGAADAEALDNLQRAANAAQTNYDLAKNTYDTALGEGSLENLRTEVESLETKTRSLPEIEKELQAIANGEDPKTAHESLRKSLTVYEASYGSLEELPIKLKEYEQAVQDVEQKKGQAKGELEKKKANLVYANEALAKAPTVDSKYDNIEDLNAYRKTLVDAKSKIDDEQDNTHEELGSLSKLLENASEEDAQAKVEECEKELTRRKEELGHWIHIKAVLEEILEDAGGNPMKEIEESFRAYISEMTDGRLDSGEMAENLGVEVKSGNHPLTWNIASDGTKDVLELALRLAILDQVFPDGGGMVVLDDPFTDMDPKRMAKACSMVERFAQRNQVIFLTCDPKYIDQFKSAKKVIEW